jgi:hypothetical protein
MKKSILFTFMLGLALILCACQGPGGTPKATKNTPTPSTMPTPQTGSKSSETIQTPSSSLTGLSNAPSLDQCNLLNSRDLASIFSSAEVVLPQAQVNQVNHLIFSAKKISANESKCVYYAYHRPGEKEMKMLQVSYWVDIPRQATSAAWAQVWKDADSNGVQAISGVGDGAFFQNGRLTFKKNDIYITIEAIGTYLDSGTSMVKDQQVQIEKQLALDVLSRLG